jgi:hypothetical protein
MSSLNDRRRAAIKPKHVRAASPGAPVDPQAWHTFKPNTLAYARLWLETGELPAETHFMILERLAPWIAAVQAGGEDLREELLAIVPAIEPRLPLPTRTWIMPTKTYPADGERDPAPEADVSNPDDEGSDVESTLRSGRSANGDPAQAPLTARRSHRATRRPIGMCETCGNEFEQPRGPSSPFCHDCRVVARREAARSHMRLIRGGLAEAA